MMLGVEVHLFLFSEEIWQRAEIQATERHEQQQGRGKGKRQTWHALADDIYTRTLQSYFDVAMGHQFGGTAWLS